MLLSFSLWYCHQVAYILQHITLLWVQQLVWLIILSHPCILNRPLTQVLNENQYTYYTSVIKNELRPELVDIMFHGMWHFGITLLCSLSYSSTAVILTLFLGTGTYTWSNVTSYALQGHSILERRKMYIIMKTMIVKITKKRVDFPNIVFYGKSCKHIENQHFWFFF